MPDNNWLPCPPPAPGNYLTRRDLEFHEDRHKFRTIRACIMFAHFDGERWNLPAQPGYYRALPGKEKTG